MFDRNVGTLERRKGREVKNEKREGRGEGKGKRNGRGGEGGKGGKGEERGVEERFFGDIKGCE